MFFALVFSTFVLGFFDVRRFCEDAEEASLKMPSKLIAAIEAGARGLAERVSSRINAYQQGPSDRACFSRTGASHQQLPQCVHDMHGPNGLDNSLSVSASSPA